MTVKKENNIVNPLNDVRIEIESAYTEPKEGYETNDEEYLIESPEFCTFGEKIWIRAEYDAALKQELLDELVTYEVIGIEVVAPRREGRLIEHPYWVYKVQPITGGEAREIEESQIVIPHSKETANYF